MRDVGDDFDVAVKPGAQWWHNQGDKRCLQRKRHNHEGIDLVLRAFVDVVSLGFLLWEWANCKGNMMLL